MKKLLICALLFLQACYNLTFDPIEYDKYVVVQQLAIDGVNSCGTPNMSKVVAELKQNTDHQFLYSSNRASRPHIGLAVLELKTMVDGLYTRYQTTTPSDAYCRAKLANISLGTSKIVKELGRFE